VKRGIVALGLTAVFIAAAVLGIHPLLGQEGKAADIRPYVAWSGPRSRIETREYSRIRSAEAWIALWARHTGADPEKAKDSYYNPAGVPRVDFERCEIVAMFQGSAWNCAGVDFLSAVEGEGRVVLRIAGRFYQTMGGADEAAPFGLFVLPRTDKPIVLEENVQGLKGQPPVWKERARLAE